MGILYSMPFHDEPVVAAIVNTSPDVVDMLRRAIEPTGIVVVSALTFQIRDGAIDFDHFMRQHDPRVVVYDIAPPYDANWRLFEHIRRLDAMKGRAVVLTSTNVAHVEALSKTDQHIYEVVGRPVDLDQIVRAVKEASRSRAVR